MKFEEWYETVETPPMMTESAKAVAVHLWVTEFLPTFGKDWEQFRAEQPEGDMMAFASWIYDKYPPSQYEREEA